MPSKMPLKKGTTGKTAASKPATPSEGVAGLKRESLATFGRVLDQWRELAKLDVAALRGIVEEMVLTVPADSRVPCADLRVSGPYAVAHGVNMLGYAVMVGKALGIGGPDLRVLGMAALLHDIGKNEEIPVPFADRPARVREDEHCMTGYRLLEELVPDLPKEVREAVRDHHERLDGSGVLKRTRVGELAYVVGICDLYDARVTPHWFRGSCSPHEAYRIVVNQFNRFPTEIANAFATAVLPYPPGSQVFLMDGRVGEVVEVNPDNSTEPKILVGGRMENLQDSRCRVLDLARDGSPA